MEHIKSVLLDIDGTLIHHGVPVSGTTEVLSELRQRNFKLRFLTNMTGKSPKQIGEWLRDLGLAISADEIQTSVTACLSYLAQQKDCRCFLALPETTKSMFKSIPDHQEQPTHVVLGDLNDGFNYDVLNKVFRCLDAGAQLVAFHRNAYFFADGKKWLDSGAFTHGLEAATGKQAIITGKPSKWFFEGALRSLNMVGEEAIFVGDDVSTDILGANRIGSHSVLVKTGKFKPEHLNEDYPRAEFVINSIDELPSIELLRQ